MLEESVTIASGERVSSTRGELRWLDVIKGLSLIWIILNHLSEMIFGNPAAGNPSSDWMPAPERWKQFLPIGHGLLGPLIDAFRYLGWTGDQGVTLFLIASGFGVTYGLLRRASSSKLRLAPFYRGRIVRIYPLWLTTHVAFGLVGIFLAGISFGDPEFYLSALGIRFTPATMYYFAPAWWYIGLLLQLYLLFPLLWRLLRSLGGMRFFLLCAAIGLTARAIGLLALHTYVDEWSRGAIFITRLPEFSFAMALAAWYHQDRNAIDLRLRAPATILASLGVFALGFALSFSLGGMTVAPLLMGVSAFNVLYAIIGNVQAVQRSRLLVWIGTHSYSIFIVHQPFFTVFLGRAALANPVRTAIGVVSALLGTIVAAVLLERVTARVYAAIMSAYARWRFMGLLAICGAIVVCGALLVGANALVARYNPQEVYGWGERPSLQPDSIVGWKLIPSRKTRLRWISYDYRVTSNALGFPGPDIPLAIPPGVLRIMTTGDAFTSAEGVDTDRSWPRLLERRLEAHKPGHHFEITNFAITGYGPNQYAAVVASYAPRIRPAVILIEMFTNDYEDVLESDDQFRHGIGFGRPDPNGLRASLGLQQLGELARHDIIGPLIARILNRPNPDGALFTDVAAFDPDKPELDKSRVLVRQRLRQIQSVARKLRARVIVALVPSSLQVCKPSDLAYYSSRLVLKDPELPQRMTRAIAKSLDITYVDLRPVLRSPGPCPYQRENLHLTQRGHDLIASYFDNMLRQGL